MSSRALILVALALSGCGSALPEHPSSANLYRDLERLVGLSEARGWEIDSVEVEEAAPVALMSACRASDAARRELAEWLDRRIAELGGPVEEAYQRNGRSLKGIDELLHLHRVRLVLLNSMARIEADCPFWLAEDHPFRGRQILDDRWLLSVGGGGKGMLLRQRGELDLSFGGAGRLLVGRAFGRHATLLAGGELGASATFPKDEGGERGSLRIAVDTVVPLVYRHRLVNSYWELEAGYLVHVTEGDLDPEHGVHVGAAFGGSASRRRWVFPGAAFGISVERTFSDDPITLIKLGFRVAIDLAP